MPKLAYDVKVGDNTATLDDDYIIDQLGQLGYNPQGVSGDGKTVTLTDDKGTYEAKLDDVLNRLGYQVQAVNVLPESAGFDTASGQLRAVVAKLPNDQMRKAALEQTLQRMGIPNPIVEGNGRDWYYLDSQDGKYKALTNTPGWDRYDAVEGLTEIPRIMGATIGGALAGGATAGAGAIPGAMAGAGIGGLVGDFATRVALSSLSPEYAKQSEENFGQQLKDMVINAAIDAGSMGLAKGVPALAGNLLGTNAGRAARAVMEKGVVSPMVKGAGSATEAVGSGVANVAKGMQTPFGRSVATMAIPGAGEAEMIGQLAQAPAAAARGLPNFMQRVGSMPTVNEFAPGLANWLRTTGAGVRRAATTPGTVSQKIANMMTLGAEEGTKRAPTAGGVLRELAERSGAKNLAGTAETVGKGLENVARAGQAVSGAAQTAAGGLLAGTQAVGTAAKGLGKMARVAGTVASPIESRTAMQRGGEYLKDEYQDYIDRLRRARERSKINTMLVNN